MEYIRGPLKDASTGLTKVKLPIDRQTLAKRRWRGLAEDGRDFGFDLAEPLKHEAAFFQIHATQYVIAQKPESLLAVIIVTPVQAARVAWQVGNLHFPLALKDDAILVEDDLALRQMFAREHISYLVVEEVFQPVGIGAGHHHHSPAHDHDHDHEHDHDHGHGHHHH